MMNVNKIPGGFFVADSLSDLQATGSDNPIEVNGVAWVKSDQLWYWCQSIDGASSSTWAQVNPPPSGGGGAPTSYIRKAQAALTFTSGQDSYQTIPDMSWSTAGDTGNPLPAGTYAIQMDGWFSGDYWDGTIKLALFVDGTFVPETEREGANPPYNDKPYTMSTSTIVTVGANASVEVRMKRTDTYSDITFHNGVIRATEVIEGTT